MTTFREVTEAWIASKEHCAGSLGRIQFWVDQFGHIPITEVDEDDVDRALEALAKKRAISEFTQYPDMTATEVEKRTDELIEYLKQRLLT